MRIHDDTHVTREDCTPEDHGNLMERVPAYQTCTGSCCQRNDRHGSYRGNSHRNDILHQLENALITGFASSRQHLENRCPEEFPRNEARMRHVFSVCAHRVQHLIVFWVDDTHPLLEPHGEVAQPLPE
jgi:hypothetical protein